MEQTLGEWLSKASCVYHMVISYIVPVNGLGDSVTAVQGGQK